MVCDLAPEPASVQRARERALAIACEYLSADQCEKLKLAVSEVVSNAVKYGSRRDKITLAITPKDGYLCVQVTDSGDGLVPSPRALAAEESGGFGLFLVERVTRRWGLTREGGTTRTWFELDYAAA